MHMASDESLKEGFSKLRPVCVRLTQEMTVENLEQLSDILDAVDPLALNELQEYVLFPLLVILKQPKESRSEKVFLHTSACIGKIISRVDRISELAIFIDLFNSFCCLISTKDAAISVAPVCEELKLETVQCLSLLVLKLPFDLLGRVYRASFLPCLGHAVTLLLSLAQHESMRQLRMAAMRCLMDLMLVTRDGGEELRKVAGAVFASFLPGAATALFRVITGDAKQGHEVTCVAISAWSSAITVVLCDSYVAEAGDTLENSLPSAEKDESRNLSVTRSPEWVKGTAEKLKIVIERMTPVASHSHWKVRLAMVRLANDLLTNCVSSLSVCVLPLLNILVRASSDEFPDIAAESNSALTTFQERQIALGSLSLIEVLEENIFTLATELPRKIMDPDDANKLNSLRLLFGYLTLLGSRIDVLLTSDVHLKRLSQALMHVLEFESSSMVIIEEQSPEMSLSRYDSSHQHRYQFKHFSALQVEDEVVRVCRLLGKHGDLPILVDHFMELFNQSTLYRKQATFCISEILTGASTGSENMFKRYTESELEALIKSILDEYLQPEHWQLPLASTSAKVVETKPCPLQLELPKSNVSINELNSNILQTCLLIDSIGHCASAVGNHFQVQLIDVLYPVLEKVGSDNAHVSQHAVACMREIARACDCRDAADLIRSGSDYLLNSVMLKWRQLQQHPQVLDVVRVMFQYGDEDILPLLNNTIHQMFDFLDLHYNDFGYQFLQVFQALVMSISKWFVPVNESNAPESLLNSDQTTTNQRIHGRNKTTADVLKFFEEYHRQKQIFENMEKNVETEEMKTENDVPDKTDGELEEKDDKTDAELEEKDALTTSEDPSKPIELPHYVQLLKEILERCRHLLILPDPHIRLLVLDVIGQSCLVLKPFQDELLPLVHKVWPPFVQRFSDVEQVVIMKAFDTLRLLASAAEDFLRRRVTEDVLPRVITSLSKLSSVSMKAGPGYRYSMSCKLQLHILNNLGYFCQQVDVKGRHITSLMHTCLPYLSARQPSCLQEACMETFRCFISTDPDSVWLLLNDVYCPTPVLQPPVDSLPCIKMAGTSERNEFTDNVIELMKLL